MDHSAAGRAEPTVSLDRSGDVWVGTFASLGTVRVHPDGEVDVEVVSADPTAADALRYGWGELLSFARQGRQLLHGGATAPRLGAPCVLVTGETDAATGVLAALGAAGWPVLGDRCTPVRFDEDAIVASPRCAPVVHRINGRAAVAAPDASGHPDPGDGAGHGDETSEQPGTVHPPHPQRVRADSNVAVVSVPRATHDHPLGAIVEVVIRHVGDDEDVELTGHDRFDLAARLHLGGALRPALAEPDAEPGDHASTDHRDAAAEDELTGGTARNQLLLEEHLRLARLPMLRLRFDLEEPIAAAERLAAWLGAPLDGQDGNP